MFLRGFVKVPVGVVSFVAASSLVKNQLGEFKNCFFFFAVGARTVVRSYFRSVLVLLLSLK